MVPEIEFESCCACSIGKFTINGIKADVDDFGDAYDHDTENRPEYGCGDYRFEPHKYPSRAVLEKYKIELIDWFEIQAMLEEKLGIGRCEWCA